MSNPARRFVTGIVAGFLLIAAATAFLVSRTLLAGLPASPEALASRRSPSDSVVLDGAGDPILRFRLVERVDPPGESPEMVVEAFLSASEPAFYEAGSSGATRLAEALARSFRGEAPDASPLSTEIARAMLGGERAGLRRRIREEILATRLDAGSPVVTRALAWLQWVPLCGGARGLDRARSECLGRSAGPWDIGESALIASAAGAGLDLRSDPDLVASRRDAALDRLVVEGLLDPQAAAGIAERPPEIRRPSGGDAFAARVVQEARRLAWTADPGTVTVSTWLDQRLQDSLASLPDAESWAAIEPTRGAVLAFGGLSSSDGPALDLALASGRRIGWEHAGNARFLRRLEVEGTGEIPLPPPRSAGGEPGPDPVAGFEALLSLPGTRGLKAWHEGSCAVLLHPVLSLAACGRDGAPLADLAEIASHLLPPAEFAMPDGARLDAFGRPARRDVGADIEDRPQLAGE